MNVDPAPIARGRARAAGEEFPQAYGGSQPGLSPRLKLVTDSAQAEAERLKDEYVSTEHLLRRDRRRRPAARPPRSCCSERGLTRDTIFAGADAASAARSA